MNLYKIYSFCALVILCYCASMTSVFAQTITEVTPFNFGTVAFEDNNSVYHITVSRSGVVTKSSGVTIISDDPVPSEFDLSGFPADTALTISFDDGTLISGGGGDPEFFEIKDYDILLNHTTDALGNYNFFAGASLYTTGSGTMHFESTYSGSVLLTITF